MWHPQSKAFRRSLMADRQTPAVLGRVTGIDPLATELGGVFSRFGCEQTNIVLAVTPIKQCHAGWTSADAFSNSTHLKECTSESSLSSEAPLRQCMSPEIMLWTAPPPAHERHGCGCC